MAHGRYRGGHASKHREVLSSEVENQGDGGEDCGWRVRGWQSDEPSYEMAGYTRRIIAAYVITFLLVITVAVKIFLIQRNHQRFSRPCSAVLRLI